MPVTTYIINEGQENQTYHLKTIEGNVLRFQPQRGWKTEKAAQRWAEKHGFEYYK